MLDGKEDLDRVTNEVERIQGPVEEVAGAGSQSVGFLIAGFTAKASLESGWSYLYSNWKCSRFLPGWF